ncbi:MAG: radical SAM protein [Chloroflexi bacterium]|nr:radical SAM protein [Chloroflexota bacterium]
MGVSLGTAAVLGLRHLRTETLPTTAYLLVGNRCIMNCAFCAQARESTARADALSRVIWPSYPTHEVLTALANAPVKRVCLQVPVKRGYLERTIVLVQSIRESTLAPICTAIHVHDLEEVQALLDAGAERVTLALDAACRRVYHIVRGGNWSKQLALLKSAAKNFPGHIGTHLIVGLGETEAEMLARLQEMVDWGVTVGLFAFTPLVGTAMAGREPPSLASYRRIQAAYHLLQRGLRRLEDYRFSADGRVVSFGVDSDTLQNWLADGLAFQTIGCPGCNRPYYNERPGHIPYNYPRPLRADEAKEAVEIVAASNNQ